MGRRRTEIWAVKTKQAGICDITLIYNFHNPIAFGRTFLKSSSFQAKDLSLNPSIPSSCFNIQTEWYSEFTQSKKKSKNLN